MKHQAFLAVIVTALTSSCAHPNTDSASGGSAPVRPPLPEVRVWGSLRAIMHEGKTEPRIPIATASTHGTYGVGALSELRGEVTIVDGLAWVSYPNDDGSIRVQRDASASNESATLLATARVTDWLGVPLSHDIGPETFDDAIEAIARANGIDVDKPFPLRVDGRLSDVKWHVVDGRKRSASGDPHDDHTRNAASGTLVDGQGMLVGFFSKHHQGVFTHMGQHTHFHVLTADHRIMGHADSVVIRAGSTLELPTSSSARPVH